MKIKDYIKRKKTYVIAEIAQGHDGSFGILESLTKTACLCGVDAVKFQMHIADAESSKYEPFRKKFSYVDKSRFDYWQRMELNVSQWKRLKKICEDHNVEFLATPFSIAAVKLLERIGVSKYKVGSGDTTNLLLIEKIARTGKEIIISSGMSDLEELDTVSKFIERHGIDYYFLHCVSQYPSPPETIGLLRIAKMMDRLNCPIGFSDHSGEIYPSLAAVALGAKIIEVHCTFDKRMFGPDSTSSLSFDQLSSLVEGIRFLEKSMNNTKKNQDRGIKKNKKIFGRSLTVTQDLKKGDILKFHNLEAKKPSGKGIAAKDFESVIGKKLIKNIKRGQFIKRGDIS